MTDKHDDEGLLSCVCYALFLSGEVLQSHLPKEELGIQMSHRSFIPLRLGLIHFGINTAILHELFVTTVFNDTAIVKHQYPIDYAGNS
jgi:hypothetical protein